MPFNGSGVFSIVNTFVPGTTIFSSAVNANFTDIATGLSTAVLKNGTQTITANLPMAGFKLTGLGVGSAAADSVRFDQLTAAPGYVNQPGYINILRRNGGLEVWQRGAGGSASIAVAAATTGGQYTADGWYLANSANEAAVVSQQAGISDGSQWSAKVLRNSGQTGTTTMVFGFPLDTDELYPALGQFVRVSFVAKSGANFSSASGLLGVRVRVGTGTPLKFALGGAYTTPVTIATLDQAITTSAARFQVSSTVIVPTTTRQMEVLFVFTPVGTAGADDSFYVDDVQLEIVPNTTQTAGPFERLNFNEQLQLCKRHYQKSFPYATAPAQSVGPTSALTWYAFSTAQPQSYFWYLPVSLRIATGATLTTYNPAAANAQIRNTTDSADFSSTTASQGSEILVAPGGTVNAGMSANDQLAVHLTVDAGI